jgi:hypothetical protein
LAVADWPQEKLNVLVKFEESNLGGGIIQAGAATKVGQSSSPSALFTEANGLCVFAPSAVDSYVITHVITPLFVFVSTPMQNIRFCLYADAKYSPLVNDRPASPYSPLMNDPPASP